MESGIRHGQKSHTSMGASVRIDWDCMVRDILKNWWMIFLTALAVALFAGAWQQFRYMPQYTADTTFVIGKAGYNYNTISANLQQAETTTKQYSQIVGSSILRKQVCEELGMDEFDATVSVETVPSSNLMKLSVTAGSPREAYLISQSVADHAVELMGYFMYGVTIQTLEEAVIPESPSNLLHIGYYMRNGAVIGFLLMMGILALISYYKDTVRNPDDVNLKVDARLLGIIQFERKNKFFKNERKKESLLLTNPMRSFAYVEAYRMLTTRIRLTMDRSRMQILMVTSVTENEGKSTVAANIALALAQEGKRVMLADCDFRKPAQYKIFGMDNLEKQDFCEAVSMKTSVRSGHVKGLPALYTLFSKKSRSEPLDSASFNYIEKLFDYLREKVDYIILDTSPMAFVSDTEEYAALADAALLVIRQDLVEACYINDVVDNLESAGTELIGCVLNGMHKGLITKTREYSAYGGSSYGKYSHYGKSQGRI